jgi:hypothetical protein
MIVDIHTHTPTHVHAVPPAERQPNTMWRWSLALLGLT